MQLLPRWQILLSLRNFLISTLSNSAATASVASSTTHCASFHSTPVSSDKWKSKWKFTAKQAERPTKNYIKYATRQKRADTKRALNDLIFRSGFMKPPFQDATLWNFDGSIGQDSFVKKKRSKMSPGRGNKPPEKKTKRSHRRDSYSSDDSDTENVFEATFGNRQYTWSFGFGDSKRFRNSYSFEWNEGSRWTGGGRTNEYDESYDRTSTIGSHSDRSALGLPLTGPLKIEDVKTAFRTAALKWHPDKHQGPSQATAEEKFKLCVNAYNSLCSALA